MDTTFLALKKLTGKGIIRVASKHNLREIQAETGAGEHIDPTRTPLNELLAGAATAAEVTASAERLMHDARVGKLRRDAVQCIEIVVSLHTASTIDPSAFFMDALAWVRNYFPVPILSAIVHRDELAPHCHLLLLPLVGGRMVGSDLVGDRKRLQDMQMSFYEQVGRAYGLRRPKARQRMNAETRAKCASIVHTVIVDNPDLLLKPRVQKVLLEVFGRNAEPLLAVLGLSVPRETKPTKSLTAIMTTPCVPEKTEKSIETKRSPKPTGFAHEAAAKDQTLSCVGFASKPESFSDLPSPSQSDTEGGELGEVGDGSGTFTRTREDEIPSELWNGQRGEFDKLKPKPLRARDWARTESERLLARLRKNSELGDDAGSEDE